MVGTLLGAGDFGLGSDLGGDRISFTIVLWALQDLLCTECHLQSDVQKIATSRGKQVKLRWSRDITARMITAHSHPSIQQRGSSLD